jgi:hypothetical protein
MFLADFHIHSTFSDGKLTVAELVDLYGTRGFGAIAITDHLCEERTWLGKAARRIGNTLIPQTFGNYLETLAEQAERAWRLYRLVVLPGFELTKNHFFNDRSAHVVALGVRGYLQADNSPARLARSIRDQGGLAVAAHPVPTRRLEKQTYQLWSRRHELSKEFDAWEVASGSHLFPEVLESGLPLIASSDLHVARQLSSWKTTLDCERHPEAILEAIRRQRLGVAFFRDR